MDLENACSEIYRNVFFLMLSAVDSTLCRHHCVVYHSLALNVMSSTLIKKYDRTH